MTAVEVDQDRFKWWPSHRASQIVICLLLAWVIAIAAEEGSGWITGSIGVTTAFFIITGIRYVFYRTCRFVAFWLRKWQVQQKVTPALRATGAAAATTANWVKNHWPKSRRFKTRPTFDAAPIRTKGFRAFKWAGVSLIAIVVLFIIVGIFSGGQSQSDQMTLEQWNKSFGVPQQANTWSTPSGTFYERHQEGIDQAVEFGAAAAAAYLGYKFSQPSNPSPNYGRLKDPPHVAPGKDFSAAQKQEMLQANRNANGGVLRSDKSGQLLVPPQKYAKGYQPPPNEAQIDHYYPRSKSGTNSYSNARVISRQENLEKGAATPGFFSRLFGR